MEETEFRVETDDGLMTTFAVHPDGDGPFPVAFLYMDGVGYREQIKDNARRFAAGGYLCVAADLFYRSGERLTLDFARMREEEAYRARARSVIGSLTPDMVMTDTQAVFDAIATNHRASKGARVCVGYCMGSRFSLHAAAAMPGRFVAAAGIHPGALVTNEPDSPHHDLARVQGELYFAFAEIDQSATPEIVDRFRQELERRGVRGVVERIPGTRHGFAMADLPVYDHAAAEEHFTRTLELWDRNVSGEHR
jgi:carboxymethylenebutenolidase